MDTPKTPILDYEARKAMPMSLKVLLLATSGAAAIGTIVVAGVVYRPVAVPTRVLGGDMLAFPTTWQSTTQPVDALSMPGTMPSFMAKWRSATQPVPESAPDAPSLPPTPEAAEDRP